MERLLILSCSQRKNPYPLPMPAIQRYDGPFFRAVRRQRCSIPSVEAYILSARFGLLHGSDEIPWYDHRLTRSEQQELSAAIGSRLKTLADPARFTEAFVCAGRDYTEVLGPHLEDLRAAVPVTLAAGGLGEKLTRLAGWLGDPKSQAPARRRADTGVIKVRGVEITASRDHVLTLARDALRTGNTQALRCHGWHVPIDGGRIAPKWLVHKLTSLPVARFHSDDARRALVALEVPVLPCY